MAIIQKVLSTLIKLLAEPDPIRERAAAVLADLIVGKEDYQKAACDADTIATLASFLKDPSPTVSIRLREASLKALAAICELREESRKQVIEAKVLSHVVAALAHPEASIRGAACLCLKSLSRSAKNLRTSLMDAGVALPLFKLLSDDSVQVKEAACAAVCNIVLEFSPMKKVSRVE